MSENLYYQTHMLTLKQHFPKVSILGQKETKGRGGGQAGCSTWLENNWEWSWETVYCLRPTVCSLAGKKCIFLSTLCFLASSLSLSFVSLRWSMERTTFVWVSFSEENLKLLIYPMFHGFLLAQKMVYLPLLMLLDQLHFIISSVLSQCMCWLFAFWNKILSQHDTILHYSLNIIFWNEIHYNQPFPGDQ